MVVRGEAKDLYDLLKARGVRVWFSKKDLGLGVPMMRAIEKDLVNFRVGIAGEADATLAPGKGCG
jgi:hypothetical protein